MSTGTHYYAIHYHRMYNVVLAYDLLEDRRAIDVIIAKFFPSYFKMEENFENLDHILRDWAKDKIQNVCDISLFNKFNFSQFCNNF